MDRHGGLRLNYGSVFLKLGGIQCDPNAPGRMPGERTQAGSQSSDGTSACATFFRPTKNRLAKITAKINSALNLFACKLYSNLFP